MSPSSSQTKLQNDDIILQDHAIKSATVSDNDSSSANQEARVEFPMKLHQLLEDAEQNGMDREIVSWLPCGRAFKIHNKIKFSSTLMPIYFKTTKYKSFHRNLNMWGFETARLSPYKGVCFNPLFVRGHPDGCFQMKHTKIKNRSTAERRMPVSLERDILDPAHKVSQNAVPANDPPCQPAFPLLSRPLGSPEPGALDQALLMQLLAKLDAELALRCAVQVDPQAEWRAFVGQLLASISLSRTSARPAQITPPLNLQYSTDRGNDFLLAVASDILCGRGAVQNHPSSF